MVLLPVDISFFFFIVSQAFLFFALQEECEKRAFLITEERGNKEEEQDTKREQWQACWLGSRKTKSLNMRKMSALTGPVERKISLVEFSSALSPRLLVWLGCIISFSFSDFPFASPLSASLCLILVFRSSLSDSSHEHLRLIQSNSLSSLCPFHFLPPWVLSVSLSSSIVSPDRWSPSSLPSLLSLLSFSVSALSPAHC